MAQTTTATVVTAFYPIKSKFPPQQYLEWAQRFLQLAAPIVLFTEPSLADTFAALRPAGLAMHIVPRPFEELDTWTLYKSQWRKAHTLDHEAAAHTPELYAIWAQKPFFVAEVVAANPFGTDTFYWCDIGAFRDPTIAPSILATFPCADRLRQVAPAILLNSVAPMDVAEHRRYPDGIWGDFTCVNRIVGGLWGGTGPACLRWLAAYEAQLIRYFTAPTDRFAGKDQSVMLSAYLEDTTLAFIAKPTTRQGDHWFFQEYLLAKGTETPLERDTSYTYMGPPPPPPITVSLMGGLGNQLFQVAAAYAHARRHGGRLVLAEAKQVEDGRPMYWSSVLWRFRHFLHAGPSPLFIKPAHWEPAATEYAAIPRPCSLGQRLMGYYQSPKYFQSASKELRALFAPGADCLATVRERYSDLLEMRERVVVVHARRGDYVKAAAHHGPLEPAYYERAMQCTQQKVRNPLYLLVSDEPMWWMQVMSEIPQLQQHAFRILMETDEVVTFALLQQFSAFIVANSSYSWWTAWLAEGNPVIAPAAWFGPEGPKQWEDIYMNHWVRV